MSEGGRIDEAALRAWPLPRPDADGDKESRGRVLVIGGSRELAGAAILAGTAALRAGAGKLMLAVSAAVAPWVAQAVPEARVLGLDEAVDGAFAFDERLATLVRKADAVLAGPGMAGDNTSFMASLLAHAGAGTLVLDAGAMDAVSQCAGRRCLITPHAGELAHLLQADKAGIERDPAGSAVDAARRFRVVVALKGPLTCIADPRGRLWRHEGGNAGLGTSGSGDVLAGVIAGLAARGAPPEQAAAWGVALHARAGDRLARQTGEIGYLARELPGEIPALMSFLS